MMRSASGRRGDSYGRGVGGPDLLRNIPNIADHNVGNHLVTKTISMAPLAPSTSYFNSAKNAVYSRYSTNDWELSNSANFAEAERNRNQSEKIRSDVFRTVRMADQATRSRQQSNTRKLGDRVKDIAFWKDELLKEIHLMEEETNNLLDHRKRLEQALRDTYVPLSIAEECLSSRERRVGIDLVQDDVERCLTKEIEVIKKCQYKMQRLLEKVDMQARLNVSEQKACESDLNKKCHAHGVDDRMQQLRNSSSRIGFFPGIEDVDNTVTIPATWVRFTEENLTRSQNEREKSAKLRGMVDATLRACAADMWAQHNAVDSALNARAQQMHGAKAGLHTHLQKVNNEILDMEKSIDMLKIAIADKEAPLKVAQTRLDERSRRIDVELCNDKPMAGLQAEIRELRETLRVLNEKLRAAELSLNRLLKSRATLERDISVKDASIDIDARVCVGLRKSLARVEPSRTGPSFSMSLPA